MSGLDFTGGSCTSLVLHDSRMQLCCDPGISKDLRCISMAVECISMAVECIQFRKISASNNRRE